MALIKWLAELGEEDVHLAGGKAANLGVLFNNDFPVPNGFVVSAEFFNHFLTKTGIKNEINNYLEKLDVEDHKRLEQVSESIRELFLGRDIPPADSEKIEQAYRDLNGRAVVVRSSSTFEDSERASFAGQHETSVNVTTFGEVVNSVKKCWTSLYTPRVLAYAGRRGVEMKDAEMGVIVQRMIEPEKAGVMFTCHPSKGARFLLIESNWGFGGTVVSGQVTPDRYSVKKGNFAVISKEISDKRKIEVTKSGGSTQLQNIPKEQRGQSSLKKNEIVQLAKTGIKVEKIFDKSQDLEWAFDNHEARILQTRPITR